MLSAVNERLNGSCCVVVSVALRLAGGSTAPPFRNVCNVTEEVTIRYGAAMSASAGARKPVRSGSLCRGRLGLTPLRANCRCSRTSPVPSAGNSQPIPATRARSRFVPDGAACHTERAPDLATPMTSMGLLFNIVFSSNVVIDWLTGAAWNDRAADSY
jgi:hypothetical protein